MKIRNIFSILSVLLAMIGLSGCEGEKDLIIIDGNLPIKTSNLYLVGDATPTGWSIDAPTPMAASDEDPLVFTWEGPLNKGELKLCLATGSWDNAFIRPQSNGEAIGKSGVPESAFAMHAGDPDNKWKVTDAGVYSLRFDLRNWTMLADYVRELDPTVIEPIVADNLYIVGDAAPNGWNIDDPTVAEKKSDYVYVFEGPLAKGELKACIASGSWDVPLVRPESNGCKISKTGVESDKFVFSAGPDDKWNVEESGIYRLTFDLEHWTIAAEYTGEYTPAAKLYMIGEATDGGWSWDNATEIEAQADNNDLFIWEGELGRGTMKASLVKDFGADFYRPASADCEISESGVASNTMVCTSSPDDQWKVTKAGRYRLTFNIADMTFNAEYVGGAVSLPVLYMIGEATEGGWSLDDATEVTTTTADLYVWEGVLKAATFKASFTRDFGADFYRPASADCEISESGVASNAMVCTAGPDDQWKVTKEGKYRLTFNMADMTFNAEYLGEAVVVKPLYMIGTATAGGWSLDDATQYTPVEGKDGEYTWTGTLKTGTFKCYTEKDFGAPFYRPSSGNCKIDASGISASDVIYVANPDDQWNVETEGKYTITINIKSMTIAVEYHNL